MKSLQDLADRWERDAETMSEYGDDRGSRIALRHAAQVREACRAHRRELLTPDQAEAASGYSKRRLRELTAEGKLTNHGRKGSPRYRLSDLPTKARSDDGFDAAAEARRLFAS